MEHTEAAAPSAMNKGRGVFSGKVSFPRPDDHDRPAQGNAPLSRLHGHLDDLRQHSERRIFSKQTGSATNIRLIVLRSSLLMTNPDL